MATFPSSSWPADSDHEANCVASGLPLPAAYSFTGLGSIVQKEIERKTGRSPFICTGSGVQRPFDPPGRKPSTIGYGNTYGGARRMAIRPGLVTPGVGSPTTIAPTVQAYGRTLASSEYRFLPLDAPYKNEPYEEIEFTVPMFYSAGSLLITADWGYWNAIDADIWAGALAVGLAYVCKDILEGIFGSPTLVAAPDIKIQQDSFRELGDSALKKAWGDGRRPGLLTGCIWNLIV